MDYKPFTIVFSINKVIVNQGPEIPYLAQAYRSSKNKDSGARYCYQKQIILPLFLHQPRGCKQRYFDGCIPYVALVNSRAIFFMKA